MYSINNALKFWLPEITVTDVKVENNPDYYKAVVIITYLLIREQVEESLQINLTNPRNLSSNSVPVDHR